MSCKLCVPLMKCCERASSPLAFSWPISSILCTSQRRKWLPATIRVLIFAESTGMMILYYAVVLVNCQKCSFDSKWAQYLLCSTIKASHLIAFQFHLYQCCLIDASCCIQQHQQTCAVFCQNGQWSLDSGSQKSTIYKANKQVQNIKLWSTHPNKIGLCL